MQQFIQWGGLTPEQLKAQQQRLLEEHYLLRKLNEARLQAGSAIAAVGGKNGGSGVITFDISTVDGTYFGMSFTTEGPIEFTVDWGDGTTHVDEGLGGFYEETHTYPETAQVYTATITFNTPDAVRQLDFYDESAKLTTISGLRNLPNLQDFRADYQAFTTVDLSGLTNLTYVDISDCSLDSTKTLTSVNLTGCTALIDLRLDDSDFSQNGIASIQGLSDLVNLENLDIDQCEITGSINLSMLPNLQSLDLNGNTGLTQLTINQLQPISNLNGSYCAFTQSAVDSILDVLSENGVTNGNVYLNGGTSSHPSTEGASDKVTLEAANWYVDVNSAPPGTVGIAASTDFDIVGDFTIEMFVNFSNLNGFPRPYSFGAYPAPNAISFENGTVYFWGNAGARSFGNFTPSTGQWYHICVMRSNDDIYIFNNGEIVSVYSYPSNIPSLGLPLTIGDGNEPGSSFNGLMSNFRWTSSAVYPTTGFSVPTSPLTDLTDTKLLIFQGTSLSAQLTDNSGNGHNGTGSNVVYNAASPFTGIQGSLQLGIV